MNPQQPNQYDFMTAGPQRQAGPSFLRTPKGRLIASIVFVVAILVIGIVILRVFSSIAANKETNLIDAVAYQTELIRVGELALKDAREPSTKTKLKTLLSFVTTDMNASKDYLKSAGVKLDTTQLRSRRDAKVADQLEAAKSGNFDQVALEIIDKKATSYRSSLSKALGETSGKKRRSTIQNGLDNLNVYYGTTGD